MHLRFALRALPSTRFVRIGTLLTKSRSTDRTSVAAMATAKQVTTTLNKLLPTLDLGTTTERSIRQTLAEKLGDSVEEHKALIKVLRVSPRARMLQAV